MGRYRGRRREPDLTMLIAAVVMVAMSIMIVPSIASMFDMTKYDLSFTYDGNADVKLGWTKDGGIIFFPIILPDNVDVEDLVRRQLLVIFFPIPLPDTYEYDTLPCSVRVTSWGDKFSVQRDIFINGTNVGEFVFSEKLSYPWILEFGSVNITVTLDEVR